MSINSKMTALADEIRELSGTTTPKSLDAMTSDVDAANTEIAEQTDLISQIQAVVDSLPEAGSGEDPGNSGGSYGEGYDAGYADGEAAALEGYIDWSIATTSSSCLIYFCNNHPSYSVSISFIVYEYHSGEEYSNDVIIPAGGEYTWEESDMGDIGFTESEWELAVPEMRFIKDET